MSTRTASIIPAVTAEDGQAQELVARYAAAHAHFQDLRERFAWFPEALGAVDYMYEVMIGQGNLDRWQRELVFVASCDARGDAYLARAVATQLAAHLDVTVDEAMAIARSEAGPPASVGQSSLAAALAAFARKVGTTPYKMVEADVRALEAEGLSVPDFVEVLTVGCLSGYMSVLSQTAHLAPAEEK